MAEKFKIIRFFSYLCLAICVLIATSGFFLPESYFYKAFEEAKKEASNDFGISFDNYDLKICDFKIVVGNSSSHAEGVYYNKTIYLSRFWIDFFEVKTAIKHELFHAYMRRCSGIDYKYGKLEEALADFYSFSGNLTWKEKVKYFSYKHNLEFYLPKSKYYACLVKNVDISCATPFFRSFKGRCGAIDENFIYEKLYEYCGIKKAELKKCLGE